MSNTNYHTIISLHRCDSQRAQEVFDLQTSKSMAAYAALSHQPVYTDDLPKVSS